MSTELKNIRRISGTPQAPLAPTVPATPSARKDSYRPEQPGLGRLTGGAVRASGNVWTARTPAQDPQVSALLSQVAGATPEELQTMRPRVVTSLEKLARRAS